MRQRDYRSEYQQRVARGVAAGRSRSQARGACQIRRAPIKQAPARDTARLRRGVKTFLQHGSIPAAAKAAGVSAERLRRELYEQRIAQREGHRVQRLIREIEHHLASLERTIKVGFEAASLIGTYLNAVGKFLVTNDVLLLAPFEGVSVTDLSGKRHPFETDPNALYELTLTSSGTFEQVYRLTTVI